MAAVYRAYRVQSREVGSRLSWRLRCPPQHKKPKKLEERGGGPMSMGIWFLWVILIWKGRGLCSDAELDALGLEQQRFGGKPVGFRVGCWGPREAVVGRPWAEKSGYERNGMQGNFRHQEEVEKLWSRGLGPMEPEVQFLQAQAILTVQGVCIQGSPSICMGRVFVVLWEVNADWWRVLYQWNTKSLFLGWLSEPLILRRISQYTLPSTAMTLVLLAPLLPSEPLARVFLTER